MALYNSKDEKLENIKEIQFKLEKDIQVLCEKNMDVGGHDIPPVLAY
jgi:hypothetical protein